MKKKFPSLALYLLALGAAQCLFAPLRPNAQYWLLTPIGLWTLAAVWIESRAREGLLKTALLHSDAMNAAQWYRRMVVFIGGRFAASWKPIILLSAISYLIMALAAARIPMRDFFRGECSMAVPLALASYALWSGFLFLLLEFRADFPRAFASLALLGAAGRLFMVSASLPDILPLIGQSALADLNPANQPPPWGEYEAVWLILKAAILAGWGIVLDLRSRRRLAPAGIRELAAEACEWLKPRMVGEENPLFRIFRRRWFLGSAPFIILVSSIFLVMMARGANARQTQILFCAPIFCATSLAILFKRSVAGLLELRRRGVLSMILLTRQRSSDILSANASASLGGFRRTLGLYMAILFGLHLWVFQLGDGRASYFYFFFLIPLAALLLGYLAIGPLMNLAMRLGNAPEIILKISLRLVVLEALAIGLTFFLIGQDPTQGSYEKSQWLMAMQIVMPQSILALWVYAAWQRLLKDFDQLAHEKITL